MQINTVAMGAGISAGNGPGSSVAQLQAKLKDLFNKVKDLAKDTSIEPKLKKMMQKSLQAQIQLLYQQIADAQSHSAKRVSSNVDIPEGKVSKSQSTHVVEAEKRKSDGIDTFA